MRKKLTLMFVALLSIAAFAAILRLFCGYFFSKFGCHFQKWKLNFGA